MVLDVKRFDIYRKVPKDLTQPTLTGAVISISCVIFIVYLLVAEFYAFLSVDVISELLVDDPEKASKISVSLNITLPNLDCQYLGVDIQDDLGRHEVGYVSDTVKTPVGVGCNFQTKFYVNKVPGNFHVSTHAVGHSQPENPNMLHHIHSLTFGQEIDENIEQLGSFRPLNEHNQFEADPLETHDYILKIVPSTYQKLGFRDKIYAYQYTYLHRKYQAVTHHGVSMPAIWFRYELSPIAVRYTERRQPLYHFLTTVCAIVGGTFTVAGIVDSTVFSASEMYKKWEMGKLS